MAAGLSQNGKVGRYLIFRVKMPTGNRGGLFSPSCPSCWCWCHSSQVRPCFRRFTEAGSVVLLWFSISFRDIGGTQKPSQPAFSEAFLHRALTYFNYAFSRAKDTPARDAGASTGAESRNQPVITISLDGVLANANHRPEPSHAEEGLLQALPQLFPERRAVLLEGRLSASIDGLALQDPGPNTVPKWNYRQTGALEACLDRRAQDPWPKGALFVRISPR